MTETVVSCISWDVDEFQWLDYDLPDEEITEDLLSFWGSAKSNWWRRVPVRRFRPSRPAPDFWCLSGTDVLVMSEETRARVRPFVDEAGELLPLLLRTASEEIAMWALNVTNVVDCMDPAARPTGRSLAADFVVTRLPPTGLFRDRQLATRIFHVERSNDADSFRRRVDTLALKGISFTPVWSSVAGPLHSNLLAFGAP